MSEKNQKNEIVTMDLNHETTDRFGYVPPNMKIQGDLEKRGYVPPSVERRPVDANADSGNEQDNSSEEQSQ